MVYRPILSQAGAVPLASTWLVVPLWAARHCTSIPLPGVMKAA